MSEKVKIYFEAEEIFGLMQKNNHNVMDTLLLIRLMEFILSARQIYGNFDERIEFYKHELSKIYGEEIFHNADQRARPNTPGDD